MGTSNEFPLLFPPLFSPSAVQKNFVALFEYEMSLKVYIFVRNLISKSVISFILIFYSFVKATKYLQKIYPFRDEYVLLWKLPIV